MPNPSQTAARLMELIETMQREGKPTPSVKQLAMILEVTETEVKDAKTLLVRQQKVTIVKSKHVFGPDQFIIQGNAPIVPTRRQVREKGWEERDGGVSGRMRRDLGRAKHASLNPMTPEEVLGGLLYRTIDAGRWSMDSAEDIIATWGPMMMAKPSKNAALRLAPKPACENCGEAFVPVEEWEVHCICCAEDATWPDRAKGEFGNYA